MSKFAEEHKLDVDFETARALHRIVRGMHDGECPKCHTLSNSNTVRSNTPLFNGWTCQECGFYITYDEAQAAIKAFAPVMEKNLEIFEEWRKTL